MGPPHTSGPHAHNLRTWYHKFISDAGQRTKNDCPGQKYGWIQTVLRSSIPIPPDFTEILRHHEEMLPRYSTLILSVTLFRASY